MAMGTGEKPAVEYFFDTSCPWSYLALERVRDAALRTGARIVYRPVLVDDVLKLANPAFPADRTDPLPVRARYQAKDLADWARYCGLTIRRPQPWPLRTEWAQRGAVVAARSGQASAYLGAIFAALFAANRRIGDRAVVEALAAEAGLDPVGFAAGIGEQATLTEVERNGADLLARGGFGTPTLLVGDDLYFGNDRLPLVEAALARQSGLPLVLPGAHGA
jgi:2-hydroxychromene-2-carboxylate isomerase